MRHTTTMVLGLVAVTALLALVLAVPVAAERGYLSDWRGDTQTGQVTIDEASTAAEGWLAENGYTDLVVAEVVDVDGRYYVIVDDAEGNGAVDLFVSRDGSSVHPAPTMLWNTDDDLMANMMSGMMSGMMGDGMDSGMMGGDHQRGSMNDGSMSDMDGMSGMSGMSGMMDPAACQAMMGVPAEEPLAEPLTAGQAADAAQAWLDANRAGSTATGTVSFPGYVTLRVSDGATITGLIAVQLTTGTVWPINGPAS